MTTLKITLNILRIFIEFTKPNLSLNKHYYIIILGSEIEFWVYFMFALFLKVPLVLTERGGAKRLRYGKYKSFSVIDQHLARHF